MPEFRYKSIEDLNIEGRSYEFYLLTQAAPNQAGVVIERLFRDIDINRLEEFGEGRGYTVFALEYMLRFEATFWIAARILRKLATAENEKIGNNATGVWGEIFSIFSGRTSIPVSERLLLIREALENANWKTRLIGVKGLKSLLQNTPHSVGLGIEGYIAPPQWRPKIWGEVYELHKEGLQFLETALNDSVSDVIDEAQDVLLDVAPRQIRNSQEITLNILYKVEKLGNKLPRLRGTLQTIIENENEKEDKLNAETISRIEKLFGDITEIFSQRLRRWVGEWTQQDRQLFYADEENNILEQLVDEVISHPKKLDDELEWLHSSEASYSYTFSNLLGVKDSNRRWFKPIMEVVSNDPDAKIYPLIGYLVGSYERGDREWVETLLEDWFGKQQLATVIFFVVVRVTNIDNLVLWMTKLIDTEQVNPEYIGNPEFTRQAHKFSVEEMQSLLIYAVEGDTLNLIEGGLKLLARWLESHIEQADELIIIALSLLGNPILNSSVESYQRRGFYDWKQIANVYVDEHPIKVAQETIKLFNCTAISRLTGPNDERIDILQLALANKPKEVWDIIGIALLDENRRYCFPTRHYDWNNREPEMFILIRTAGIAVVSEWIQRFGVSAARRIAEIVHVLEVPLPEMVRFLLINYGDDKDVLYLVNPNYSGFAWSGKLSDHYIGLIDIARQWMSDKEPIIRKWAQDIVTDLEQRYYDAKRQDDEDELRW